MDWRDSKGPDLEKKLLSGFISQIFIKKVKIKKSTGEDPSGNP
jgi:hypothetical protein